MNSRPASSGMPIVAKYSGLTASAYGLMSSSSDTGRPGIRIVTISTLSAITGFTPTAADRTPGIAAIFCWTLSASRRIRSAE